ncbi:MAG TPA: hypothetical protein VK996_15155, partial [Ramlibacter sp.]|nr:hypothetical protein [Ramlibacter sp.]
PSPRSHQPTLQESWSFHMGNKIVTEADRKRSPAPKPTEGYKVHRDGGGQKGSQERGTWTRSKKNPGKRPHKGG